MNQTTNEKAGGARSGALPRRKFGKTGLEVSPVGFGAAPAAFIGIDARHETELIETLLNSGANLIDTAAGYPGSEQFLGKHLGHRRKDVVLVSKCGWKVPDVGGEAFSAELVAGTVDRALKLLNTDHLDVMLLHSCDLKTLQRGDALAELVKARKAGKIRFAGYSGDNEAAEHAATMEDVAVIETSINICDQRNIDVVLPDARQAGVGLIAKRPMANAAWKELSKQSGMYRDYARDYTQRLTAMQLSPRDLGFSGSAAAAWAEIALRFTLSQPGVDVAIVGTTNVANARANLAAAAKGPLPADVIGQIRQAFRQADQEGKWLGLT